MVRRTQTRNLEIPGSCYARPGMTEKAQALFPSLLQIVLHLGPQAIAQIGARHAERDVGAQEA
jgi:hypothetical protein